MITNFHADTGYHVNQFHGRTVSGQQWDNILSATIKNLPKNTSRSLSFEHHETIRIKENLDTRAYQPQDFTKSVLVKHALLF